MANRNFNRPWCYQKMLTFLTGKVSLSAGAAVTSNTGIGYTVAKTGTGQYTFTLDDQFNDVQFAYGRLVEDTITTLVGNFRLNYTSIKTQKLGTILFQIVNNSAAATDVSAASEIHFCLGLVNSSVPR